MLDLRSDPKLKDFFDYIASCHENWKDLSLDEIRQSDTAYIKAKVQPVMAVKGTEEVEVPGSGLRLRIYTPLTQQKALPVGVYFHGGGWVFGSIDQSDHVARLLANGLESIIVSVEYRLAPEFPFPNALEDCYRATSWVAEQFQNSTLFVVGESAGANLAAAVALMAKDKQGPKLDSLILIYPVITSTLDDTTYANCPDQYFITKDTMQHFWNMYLKDPENAKNPYASLDLADLTHLPPTLIVTAEYDPLKPEADKFATKLKAAGVQVKEQCIQGALHGCLFIPPYDTAQKYAWVQSFCALSLEGACYDK